MLRRGGLRAPLDKPADASGLMAVGARYYDPTTGRSVSVDPVMDLADPQQWHGYAYANNNPITWSDPTGLAPMIDGMWGTAKAAAVATTGQYVPQDPKPPTIRQTLQRLEDEHRIEEYVAVVDSLTAEDWQPEMYLGQMQDYWDRANAYRTELQTCEWAPCMEPCADSLCEAGRAGLLVVEYAAGELVGLALPGVIRWLNARIARVVEEARQNPELGAISLPGRPMSVNQMNRAIQRGHAPTGIRRVDTGRIYEEQTHVHFEDGAALNIDGSWKHGTTTLSRDQADWLEANGWVIPRG